MKAFDLGNGQLPSHRHVNPDGELGGWVDDSARIGTGVFVGHGAVVGKGTVVGENARVYKGARVKEFVFVGKGALVCDGAYVGDDAYVGEGAYVGNGAHIGKGAYVGDDAIVSKGAFVGDCAFVGSGAYTTVHSDSRDFKAIRDAYLKAHPNIPVVEDLDGQILALIEANSKALDMCNVHTCETTHCRAGWAVTLAGEAGKELERQLGWETAGGLIYRVSTGRWPNFFSSEEDAISDMRKWAGENA